VAALELRLIGTAIVVVAGIATAAEAPADQRPAPVFREAVDASQSERPTPLDTE
jgi:hypothetical protein